MIPKTIPTINAFLVIAGIVSLYTAQMTYTDYTSNLIREENANQFKRELVEAVIKSDRISKQEQSNYIIQQGRDDIAFQSHLSDGFRIKVISWLMVIIGIIIILASVWNWLRLKPPSIWDKME